MERDPRSSPLLEFDDAVPAYIEPTEHVRARDVPRACVVTFFGDSVRRLIQSGRARLITENAWRRVPIPSWSLSTGVTGSQCSTPGSVRLSRRGCSRR